MISDEDLLRLNQEGFIPGPYENEEKFLKRIDFSKKIIDDPKNFFKNHNLNEPFDLENKILKPRWNWSRASLMNLFDVSPRYLPLFYSDYKLNFFQAAATWIVPIDENIKIPILQFRKKLKKNSYLLIYSLDEILAHEAIHSIRVAFDEPDTEEIFSYMTATSFFRKVFGPIIKDSKEVFVFFTFIFSYFVFHFFWVFFNLNFLIYFSSFFGIVSLGLIAFASFRLFSVRRKFFKALNKLTKIFNDKRKARAVLFRSTDLEIFKFAKMKKNEILTYFEKSKDLSLRLKMIYLAYFKNLKNQI